MPAEEDAPALLLAQPFMEPRAARPSPPTAAALRKLRREMEFFKKIFLLSCVCVQIGQAFPGGSSDLLGDATSAGESALCVLLLEF